MRRNIRSIVVSGVLCMLCAGAGAQSVSDEELADISASGLLYQASDYLSQENYLGAIPYLKHYLDRMGDNEEDRVVALRQSVRLKLGKVYAYINDQFAAAEYLTQYTQTLPRYKPREAWKLLALACYESEQFEACVHAATNALSNPLPKELPTQEGKVDYNELSKDDMGGFSARQMERMQKEVDEAGEDTISATISEDTPDPEPDYTVEELVFLNMTLAEAYTKLENWEASIEPYKFVIENAIASDRKGYAIMQLVNSLVALERFDDANDFIVKLYYTDARYDIRVNMALMNAASTMFSQEKYDSSLMLYRMILPRSDLVTYQMEKMNEMRRVAGLPRVDIEMSTNDMGRVQTMFGDRYGDNMAQADSAFATVGLPDKPPELNALEDSIRTLLSLAPYEEDVIYRTGLLYARSGRPWEAVAALDYIASREPDSGKGQDALVESLMVLVDPLKKYELVDERAMQFLNAHSAGLAPRRVVYALTSSYQKQERWKDIKNLLPLIEGFVPTDDEVVLQYECELYYMQAVADIVLLDYEKAKTGFEYVLNEYPDSHQEENATYWHATCQLFLKNYQDALDEYSAYAAAWTNGSWLASAAFHSGLCLFSLEKYDEAKVRFTEVINTWPDDTVYSDACSMRGDLWAAEDQPEDGSYEPLDLALKDYEEAIASARQPRQAAYAVFQMATMFELEERYEETLNVVNAYLERYGEEADVAKATFWIGKTKLAQGLTDEAVDAYLETIVEFGGDVLQDGVDMIISELLTLYAKLSDEEQGKVEAALQAALRETEDVTLGLRLRVLLAEMNGTANELGRQLNVELDDLTQAPPPVLAILCDSAFEVQDYSRAADILNLFQIRYEGSEFMEAALKLRGTELFETQQYDAAMTIVQDAQDLYGQIGVPWAQILKGRIFLAQADLESARELFRTTLAVSQWRGVTFAEATYYLGRVEEEAGNFRDAFAWYQRAYFQYKGFAGGYWAAEGYLASARCLKELGLEIDRLNTYRAMLFDKYVNKLPQANVAREVLGAEVVREISTMIVEGVQTNITVKLTAEAAE